MYLNKNYGLKKHGFITNLPGQLNSFNSLLAETGKVYTQSEQDALLDGVSPSSGTPLVPIPSTANLSKTSTGSIKFCTPVRPQPPGRKCWDS